MIVPYNTYSWNCALHSHCFRTSTSYHCILLLIFIPRNKFEFVNPSDDSYFETPPDWCIQFQLTKHRYALHSFVAYIYIYIGIGPAILYKWRPVVKRRHAPNICRAAGESLHAVSGFVFEVNAYGLVKFAGDECICYRAVRMRRGCRKMTGNGRFDWNSYQYWLQEERSIFTSAYDASLQLQLQWT